MAGLYLYWQFTQNPQAGLQIALGVAVKLRTCEAAKPKLKKQLQLPADSTDEAHMKGFIFW
jgi:hypothetical protein